MMSFLFYQFYRSVSDQDRGWVIVRPGTTIFKEVP